MNMLKQFAIYGIAGTASRLVMVFLVPLYTRVLSIEQYGQLEFLLAGAALLTILIGLQSESAVVREYHLAAKNGQLAELRWGALTIAGAGSCLVALVAFLAWAAGAFSTDQAAILPIVLAIAAATQVLGIQLVLLRFDKRAVVFGLVTFADVTLAATISVLLLVKFGWGVEGALIGVLIGKVVGIIGAWSATFRLPPTHMPGADLLRRMLVFSIPTTAPVMLNWVQTNGARVVLAAFFTLTDVAIASIGLRVAALFGFLVYAFRLAWEPWAFRQLDDPDRPAQLFDRVLKLYVVAMMLAAACAIGVSPILVVIFAPAEYGFAVVLCAGFVMGQLWLGIGNLTSIGIHGSRKTGNLITISLLAALANLALLALLAPVIGVTGAMVAFVIGAMVRAFAASAISNRVYATQFSIRLLTVAALASFALTAGAYWMFEPHVGKPLADQLQPMAAMALLGLVAVASIVALSISSSERRMALREVRVRLRFSSRDKPQ